MKLKLSHSEFTSLYEMLKDVVEETGFKPLSNDALYHIILVGLYKKFYRRAIEKMKQYNISLEPQEAIAFYRVFVDGSYIPGLFEANLVQQILNNIHQQFQTS